MTTLIMVQTSTDVIMGWDSRMTNGSETTSLVYPKVFARGNVIYGVAGLLRAADVMQYGDLPDYEGGDPRKWIVTQWVPALRDLLAEEPHLLNEKFETKFGLIMVVGGQCFEIDSALNASQSVEGVYTEGSGGVYARGAYYAGASVMESLHVAGRIDHYTGGAYTVAYASKYLETAPADSGWDGRLDTPTLY